MIKRILVPLDPSPFSKAALDWASFMAKRHGAELTGLVVLDFPGIKKSIGPVPLGGSFYAEKLQKSRLEDAKKHIQSLLSRFNEKCKKEGIDHSAGQRQGVPSHWILAESIYFDAVVMGLRTHFRFEASDKPGDSLEKVIDHSITPIYCIPEKIHLPERPGQKMKILISFNGSMAAGHALQRFAQLALPDRSDVILLSSHENREVALGYLEQAERYLRRHSFSHIQKKWTGDDILQVLEKEYLGKVDLIVVGSHSQKGLFKFKLGSVPKYLIRVARTPILIG
jgi:nucleotide-binding universal stress UspA family protein